MLLYYQSWMFYIHFIAPLYHYLGLTYWHSAKCQLLFSTFFTSQKINIKRSPNATKLFVYFFGPEDNSGAKEAPEGRPVEPTRHQGTPGGLGTPRWVVGPTGVSSTASQLYKYPNIAETLGESTKHNSSRRKSQNHEIQSRALFRHSDGAEHDHGGVHHPHWCSFDDAWVVHHRPKGP